MSSSNVKSRVKFLNSGAITSSKYPLAISGVSVVIGVTLFLFMSCTKLSVMETKVLLMSVARLSCLLTSFKSSSSRRTSTNGPSSLRVMPPVSWRHSNPLLPFNSSSCLISKVPTSTVSEKDRLSTSLVRLRKNPTNTGGVRSGTNSSTLVRFSTSSGTTGFKAVSWTSPSSKAMNVSTLEVARSLILRISFLSSNDR